MLNVRVVLADKDFNMLSADEAHKAVYIVMSTNDREAARAINVACLCDGSNVTDDENEFHYQGYRRVA